MTIWLIIVACLASSPQHCREFDGGGIEADNTIAGMLSCGLQGQEMAAQWEESHPGWEVSKISCQSGDKPALGEDL